MLLAEEVSDDIQDGIADRDFTSGKTLDDYRGNAMLRSAVEAQFEIIGEAWRSSPS